MTIVVDFQISKEPYRDIFMCDGWHEVGDGEMEPL